MGTTSIDWVKAATEKSVPRENGVALCSLRDPVLEAQQWIKLIAPQVSSSKIQELGILGLGAGYHVHELKKVFTREVIVFENRPELVKAFPSTPGVSVVDFDEQSIGLVARRLCSEIDLLVSFRPSWGMQVGLYTNLRTQIIGADIKTMQLEKWRETDHRIRPQLELLWEIIK